MAVLYQSDGSTRKSDIQCVLGYPSTSVKVSQKNALFISEINEAINAFSTEVSDNNNLGGSDNPAFE